MKWKTIYFSLSEETKIMRSHGEVLFKAKDIIYNTLLTFRSPPSTIFFLILLYNCFLRVTQGGSVGKDGMREGEQGLTGRHSPKDDAGRNLGQKGGKKDLSHCVGIITKSNLW